MHIKVLSAILLTLCVSTARAVNNDLQFVDLPNGATTSWVATDMNHNGHGMAVKTLSTNQSVEEVMNFYRTAWGTQGDSLSDIPSFVEKKVGEWRIISRISESHNLVVQIKTGRDGDTEGFISSMALVAKPQLRSDSIPTPPNTSQVSHTRTGDKGKTGHTTILVTPSSVGAAVGFYKDHLSRDGWILVSDEFVEGSHVMKFNKRISAFEIVVSAAQDGTTVILLNRTQSNG
ncbi:MAG: hypothetical protein V3U65_11410 [Granulosicoccaceae bacterium]